MSELYQVKPYEDMTDGEPVLAYGIHVVRWDFARFGVPHYGIVPAADTEPEIAALDALRAELAAAKEEQDAAYRRVEQLSATLDGDPHMTATPEQRRAWRVSAVRYADKAEADLAAARADAERLAKALQEIIDAARDKWSSAPSIEIVTIAVAALAEHQRGEG